MLMQKLNRDSVKQITEFWGDANIEAIYNLVLKWKSTRKIEKNNYQRQKPHVPNRIED